MKVGTILVVVAAVVMVNVIGYLMLVEAGRDSYPKPAYIESNE